ncbi:hypothetical protein BJX65DRAFT_85563 [Aspergillus insuetus]
MIDLRLSMRLDLLSQMLNGHFPQESRTSLYPSPPLNIPKIDTGGRAGKASYHLSQSNSRPQCLPRTEDFHVKTPREPHDIPLAKSHDSGAQNLQCLPSAKSAKTCWSLDKHHQARQSRPRLEPPVECRRPTPRDHLRQGSVTAIVDRPIACSPAARRTRSRVAVSQIKLLDESDHASRSIIVDLVDLCS